MMWSNETSLYDMQKDIERIIENRVGMHVKLGDVLDISLQDYATLTSKIKEIHRMEEIELYSLAIIVTWVASYKFLLNGQYIQIIKKILSDMPQHHTKYVFETFATTFYDYQIDNFGFNINGVGSVDEVMKRHAGWE